MNPDVSTDKNRPGPVEPEKPRKHHVPGAYGEPVKGVVPAGSNEPNTPPPSEQ